MRIFNQEKTKELQLSEIDFAHSTFKDDELEGEQIMVCIPITEEMIKQQRKKELRRKRELLLVAFDTYKGNVEYGIEQETEEQHEHMLAWYEALKNLEELAFEVLPARIRYYYERK